VTLETLAGISLIFLVGLIVGVWLDRTWILKRGRGTLPVPKRRKPFDLRVKLVDLYGHQKWLMFPMLDVDQHKKLANHIVRFPGQGCAKLTYSVLTPASKRIMSKQQLDKVRAIWIARDMVIYNPRSGELSPLPPLAVWADGVLRWARRTERQERKERRE
jgi:hypothetical protein